jgi:hypothetical protein
MRRPAYVTGNTHTNRATTTATAVAAVIITRRSPNSSSARTTFGSCRPMSTNTRPLRRKRAICHAPAATSRASDVALRTARRA